MSPILKKALWRESLHQSGLMNPMAWLASAGMVALFTLVGTLEKVM